MHKLAFILFALGVLSLNCDARQFSRCELVQELRAQGFPATQLRDWVCLVEATSYRNTGFISPPSNVGARGWGLFQIWDVFWCSTTHLPGKDCNVRCLDLVTPDITRASNCAKLIYIRHGFSSWSDYMSSCVGKPLPDISAC